VWDMIWSPAAGRLSALFWFRIWQRHTLVLLLSTTPDIDGIQQSGETGFPAVTVNLMSPGPDGIIGTGDDTTITTTATDSFGLYEFTNVPAGTYYVNFALPAGSTFSPIGTGNVLTANSNVNPATGNTGLIPVTATTEYGIANAGLYQQFISINDVTITRPHSGLAPMTFTVTLSPVNLNVTDVPYATADGTATVANNDYLPTSGTLVFPVGVTSETITVQAVGNLIIENNVAFTVNLTAPPDYIPAKIVGTGTILDSNFPVATVSGPPAQTRSATVALVYPFVISLSATAPFTVSVPYTTMDQSAVANVDYVPAIGTAVFGPGTTTLTIDVSVNPGVNPELDKTFLFELTTPPAPITEVVGTPSQATGTILTNVLPGVNAVAGQVTESLTGLAYLPFNVDVNAPLTSGFSVSYATSNGTAIAGTDYQAESGTLSFGPGRIQQTVYVPVFRQFIQQQQKTLSFTISNPSTSINLITPVVTGTINYVTLSALPFSAAKRVVYTDALNQRVTVSMQGVGSGNVVFLGTASNATNAYEVVVNNTNAASSVTMKVARGGQTSLTKFDYLLSRWDHQRQVDQHRWIGFCRRQRRGVEPGLCRRFDNYRRWRGFGSIADSEFQPGAEQQHHLGHSHHVSDG